jgi:hypothetical protein
MKRPALLCLALAYWAFSLVQAQELSPSQQDFLYLFIRPEPGKNQFTFRPQLDLAEGAGVDKFTFYCGAFPRGKSPSPEEWAKSDNLISMFLQSNPASQVAPRIVLPSNVGDAGLTADEAIKWGNGESRLLSWTSPKVQQAALDEVRNVVEHCEASPAGPRIWAYHLTAQQTGEWIIEGYKDHGPDCSEPSRTAFQAWLGKTYPSDQELQESWGNSNLQRDQAEIPLDTEKRFSWHNSPAKQDLEEAFYQLPQEQNWVDYSKFASDNNADCIRQLARQVKFSSHGAKKVIVFYGYEFELSGSISGHLAVRSLLDDPDIDFIAAPISYTPYTQRLAGGIGGSMGVVDSMALHGKTWINEDDLHTHAQMPGVTIPPWYWDIHHPGYYVPGNLTETSGILERNLAFAAYHHAATWWMDLIGGGWFSDPRLWDIWKGPFGTSMREIRSRAVPYTPQVAVVLDEESRFYERLNRAYDCLYPQLRTALMGSGATVGFYYLDDYLDGKIPPTPATVFVNLWRLDAQRSQALKTMMRKRGGTVVWQYAPGYLDVDHPGIDGVRDLTGIRVRQDDGVLGSTGVGPLKGLAFGHSTRMKPRILIDDPQAEQLAQYDDDHLVSAAMKTTDGVRQVLLADDNWSPVLVHTLLQECQIPLYTDLPAVVEADKQTLFVYATDSGTYNLTAPPGATFNGGRSTTTVTLEKNENRLFRLVAKTP